MNHFRFLFKIQRFKTKQSIHKSTFEIYPKCHKQQVFHDFTISRVYIPQLWSNVLNHKYVVDYRTVAMLLIQCSLTLSSSQCLET